MKRWLICLMALLLLCQTAFALSASVTVSASSKAYRSASTSSASVRVSKNTKLTLTAIQSGWARVANPKNGTVAYMPLKILKLKSSITVYAAKSCTLYKKASTSSKVASIAKGAKLTASKVSGDYLYVKVASSGKKGYVPISLVTSTEPASSSSSSTASSASKTKIDKVVSIARSYLGVPYSTRSNPPKTFDCSSFSRYCYKQVGVSLGSNAKSQGYSEKYKKIAKTSGLTKGDLVFFDTVSDSDLCDHVGIYISGGNFIHASSAGGKVIISSLSSGYYKKQFSWGRRILG